MGKLNIQYDSIQINMEKKELTIIRDGIIKGTIKLTHNEIFTVESS